MSGTCKLEIIINNSINIHQFNSSPQHSGTLIDKSSSIYMKRAKEKQKSDA